jgi:hypothetical protein
MARLRLGRPEPDGPHDLALGYVLAACRDKASVSAIAFEKLALTPAERRADALVEMAISQHCPG